MSGQADTVALPGRITRAVTLILGAPTFAGHEDRFDAFSTPAGDADRAWDFEKILADWPWSAGEHVALRCAEALYRGTSFPGTHHLSRMDYDLLARVEEARAIALGLHLPDGLDRLADAIGMPRPESCRHRLPSPIDPDDDRMRRAAAVIASRPCAVCDPDVADTIAEIAGGGAL